MTQETLSKELYLFISALQIVPADHEQVSEHSERVHEKADAAAMTMFDHTHRNRLNGKFSFARHIEHLHVEAKAVDGRTSKDFPGGRGFEAFESALRIRQA